MVEFLAILKPVFLLAAVVSLAVCGVLVYKNKDTGQILCLFGVTGFFACVDMALYSTIISVTINGVEIAFQLMAFSFSLSAAIAISGVLLSRKQIIESAKKKAAADLASKNGRAESSNSIFRR